jgi:DNA modification methylase
MTGETLSGKSGTRKPKKSDFCAVCGAWRGHYGAEPTPEMYVEHTVLIFREVRRVLRDDGTLWINLGDSYAGSGGAGEWSKRKAGKQEYAGPRHNNANRLARGKRIERGAGRWGGGNNPASGDLKPKDLVGIPWMVAFALRADGWYLRQDIIWNKENPMPESVVDRCTKSHEYIFLLSKRAKYYCDMQSIAEPAGSPITKLQSHHDPDNPKYLAAPHERWKDQFNGRIWGKLGTRNKRSVWDVNVQPYSGAHFATFPPVLVEPCIKSGCPEGGVVLDPFSGSGTTAMVARKLGRRAIGLDLSFTYIQECARPRLQLDALEEFETGRKADANYLDLPLFAEL